MSATTNFAWRAAAGLYERNVHPRLLLGPRELESLRVRRRTGWPGKLLTSLRRKVRPLVAAVRRAEDLPGRIRFLSSRDDPDRGFIVKAVHDIAMVGVLDEDARTIGAARRVLAAIPDADAPVCSHPNRLARTSVGDLAFAYDLLCPHMPPAERRAFAKWAAEQSVRKVLAAIRPRYLANAGANTPLVGMVTAILNLLAIEGEPGAGNLAREKAELLKLFEASSFAAIGRDGYPTEDIGYGTVVVGYLARVAECVRRAGLYDAYARCPRYARAGRAILHFVQPWGRWLSNTGDYGDHFASRDLVLPRLAAETNDAALLWLHGALCHPPAGADDPPAAHPYWRETVLQRGFHVPTTAISLIVMSTAARPARPTPASVPTAFADRDRGIVSFRSGWKKDDTLVIFDGSHRSPAAQGHAHYSGGHFSLSALGEYFAIDTGRYHVEAEQHNVVLVDGKSGRSTRGQWASAKYQARLIDYRPGAFCDFAAVDYSQQSDCYRSRRHLGLVKGAGAPGYVWTVEDVNFANDFRRFWWTLNTHPCNKITLRGKGAVIEGCRRGNRLNVHFALPSASSYPRPHTLEMARDVPRRGSHEYTRGVRVGAGDLHHTVHRAVYKRPRLIAKVSGLNGRFMSVMIPRKKGRPAAKVAPLKVIDNSLAMRISFEQVEDTLIWAYEHNMLAAAGVIARGQWVVVRRSRKTGRLLDCAMGAGESLQVDGKNIKL